LARGLPTRKPELESYCLAPEVAAVSQTLSCGIDQAPSSANLAAQHIHHGHPSRLLRPSGGRRGEDATHDAAKERSPIHQRITSSTSGSSAIARPQQELSAAAECLRWAANRQIVDGSSSTLCGHRT